MRYTQKTSSAHVCYYVSKQRYQFDRLESVEHISTGKYWDEKNQRWVRRHRAISHGVNSESDSTNTRQISVEVEAEKCKGYDPYDMVHW